MNEPVHPTYGTLDEFLTELGRDIKEGWLIRIGQTGALNWFSGEYGRKQAATNDGEREGAGR